MIYNYIVTHVFLGVLNAIQNAELQSVNLEISFHEVRIQLMNVESISGIQSFVKIS